MRPDRPVKKARFWFANTLPGWFNRPRHFVVILLLLTALPLLAVYLTTAGGAIGGAILILTGWVLALAGTVAVAFRHYGEPAGWSVGPTGLRTQTLFCWTRRLDWTSVREVLETSHGLEVVTDSETLRLRLKDDDAVTMAAAIREQLEQRGTITDTIPAERVAGWLGIGLDDALQLDKGRWRRLTGVLLALAMGIWLTVAQSRTGMWAAPLLILPYWIWIAWAIGQPEPVTITPYGIEHRGSRFGWQDVDGCRTTRLGTMLRVGDRNVKLDGPHVGPHVDRVRHAVEQLLAARDEGAVLPRMTDVPDHALSRAESVDVSAERGISPIAGGEDE